MDTTNYITAFNVKTKQKGRPILDAVISRTSRGAYLVQGHDDNGDKLNTLCGKEKAEAAIAAGTAKWANGHDPEMQIN